jgi:hypothetical protein
MFAVYARMAATDNASAAQTAHALDGTDQVGRIPAVAAGFVTRCRIDQPDRS